MTDPLKSSSATALLSDDAEFEVSRDVVRAVVAAINAGEMDALQAATDDLHPADVADLLEQLTEDGRAAYVALLGGTLSASVLTELEEGVRDEILLQIEPEQISEIVGDLDTDDAAYLLEDLDDERKRDVLDGLEAADRIAIEQTLEYPDYSAGRLMQRDFVAVPPFWTVGQAIDMMRASTALPEQFYEIMVIDPGYRPLGAVSLGRLMGSRRAVTLDNIMRDDFRSFTVTQPQEDVAYAFNQYHLVSAPVLDENGRLAGVITIADAMEALDDETEEDLLRLGGVGDEELSDRVFDIVKRRFPWLLINLATAVAASVIIAQFDGVIQRVVALAALMTIIASMGGNGGTQTMTVAVRALATKDLTANNALRVIWREVAVGFLNGLAFAAVMGSATYFWYNDPALAAVLGVAMIANMVVAALAGILIPLGLDRAGADPALSSAVFVTTVTDVIGFFVFLGLAAIILL